MLSSLKTGLVSMLFAALGGCAVNNPAVWEAPQIVRASPVREQLVGLPPPAQRVAIAVYGFTDQTGQFKPSDTVQTLSRAVTQGATSILVKTLQDAGNRQWFTVIERERIDNVLRERAVIREMRASYLGEKVVNPNALPPLLFAGILLEGGIIGYDSNTKTGGSGARFLGIGAMTQYREDTVTVYLRAVSTKTGEVLSSVSVRKNIQSVSVGANAFRYVSFKDLLEIDAGVTYNEPDQLALTQAIEKAVHALILEGALQDLWCFRTDPATSTKLVSDYLAERENVPLRTITLARRADGTPADGACRVAPVAQRPAPRPIQLVQPLPVAPPPVRAEASAAARPSPSPANPAAPPVAMQAPPARSPNPPVAQGVARGEALAAPAAESASRSAAAPAASPPGIGTLAQPAAPAGIVAQSASAAQAAPKPTRPAPVFAPPREVVQRVPPQAPASSAAQPLQMAQPAPPQAVPPPAPATNGLPAQATSPTGENRM